MEDRNSLHIASSMGDIDEVSELVEKGFPLDGVDRLGRPAVTVAAELGHINVVKLLIDAGCELNGSVAVGGEMRVRERVLADDTNDGERRVPGVPGVQENNSTSQPTLLAKSPPLHSAVSSGHEDIVKLLVNTPRVDVNCVFAKETPLIIAAKQNCQDLVTILVEAGANVNFDKSTIIDYGLTTPIHYAVVGGNYDMVKYFIDHGAKYITELPLNVRTYRIPGAIALRYFGSLIELACQNNQPEILSLLIDSFEKDITFLCKHYAMLWCCQMDCKECLDILLVRLYSTDSELNNAHLAQNHQQVLRIALRQNSARDEVIPLRLLQHFGPNMFTDPTSYFITLHIGVLRVFPKFVKAMVAFLPQFPDKEEEETVQDICYSALNVVNLSILQDLYTAGLIDVKYVDHAGENAAFNVVQSNKTAEIDSLVAWLSELGVDFSKRNLRGLEPIHTAVTARTYRNIEVLVRHGVNIDSQTVDGQTSLHLALSTGWELERNVVQTLFDNGADLDIKDSMGQTPVTMFVMSYFSTFQTGQTWCLEGQNGWRWALDLLVNKLGCFFYNVHVIGHVAEADWQALVNAMSDGQRSALKAFPSLQTLCWGSIRSSVGGVQFKDKVEKLPLPQPLRTYIKTF